MNDLIVFYFPIAGGILLGGFAVAEFYSGKKRRGYFFSFLGFVCFIPVLIVQLWPKTGPNPDRPWLAIDDVTKIGEFYVFPNFTPVFQLAVKVRVTGVSPVEKAEGISWLLPLGSGDVKFVLDFQKKRCDEAVKTPVPQNAVRAGQTILAGQTPELMIYAFDYKGSFADLHDRLGMNIFSPSVVGCIVYEESDGTPHWTGLIYDIFTPDPIHPGNVKALELTAGHSIPANQLIIRPTDFGGGPAN